MKRVNINIFKRNRETIKRKIIKKSNLDTIAKTESFIEKYLDKMDYSQLKNTEDYVLKKQQKEGIKESTTIFLSLVRERLKKYEK